MSIRRTRPERVAWVDAYKAIAIISVVLGHVFKGNIQVSITPETMSLQTFGMDLVYSYHMPLFFMLSGYAYFVFLKRRPNSEIKTNRSVINLALLYFIYNVLLSLLKVVFAGFVNNPMQFSDLVRSILLPTTPMWYLYVLLFFYLFFKLIPDTANQKLWLALFCFIGIGGRILLEMWNTPSCIVRFVYYLQFFWLGGCIDSLLPEDVRRNSGKKTLLNLLAGLSVVLIIVNWALLYKGISNVIAGTLCAYGVIFVLLVIREKAGRLLSWAPLQYIGKKSLCIYLFHTYVVTANRYLYRKTSFVPVYCEIVIGLMVGISVPLTIDYFIGRLSPMLRNLLFQPGKAIATLRGKV